MPPTPGQKACLGDSKKLAVPKSIQRGASTERGSRPKAAISCRVPSWLAAEREPVEEALVRLFELRQPIVGPLLLLEIEEESVVIGPLLLVIAELLYPLGRDIIPCPLFRHIGLHFAEGDDNGMAGADLGQ